MVDWLRRFITRTSSCTPRVRGGKKFKSAYRERFKEVHTDQYHFTKRRTARQARDEVPQVFADRYKALAHKIIGKVNDPVAQPIHRENAESMCLASFVAGLVGTPGRQVRFSNPQIMQGGFDNFPEGYRSRKQEKADEIFFKGLRDNQVAQRPPQVERVSSTKMLGKHLTQVRDIIKTNVARSKRGKREMLQM